ncbi:leader peptidase (prepilin peptidase) / N-methyltransferase [Thermotomaculum hydrothermale]|uniref:Prepilin leader peptidase/N-methyltransferase n=1 Tax=Thermotomaculum hydrothermale TaxID=981385 RepID=A0A7R6PNA6_9BACT|nr:A24 family peptidase [Thermotomaculum hydrothermale]BBB32723.1 leader peptidase (prepilin peptidase) / N-methyltransferase [Thermotomaculum hydrothermale]
MSFADYLNVFFQSKIGLIFAFVLGSMFGSFFNVCIYRLPKELSIIKPRSFCPSCNKTIPWYYNIPLISWLYLRGKCAYCGAKISFRYFFVELLTALIFTFGVYKFGFSLKALEFIVLTSLMLILFFTDLYERILPDEITLGFIPIGLIFAYFSPERGFLESLVVGVIGAGLLFLLAYIYLKIKGIEGMGMGDVKMLALMGTFLGKKAFLALMIGSIIGTIVGLFIIYVLKKGRHYEIPFGCFLAIGTVITYLYGDNLIHYYVTHFLQHY